MAEVETNIFVPGRSHDVLPDGTLALSVSSVARVATAAEYYHANAETFAQSGRGLILFEGGWAKAAAGLDMPPEEFREGRLMRDLATELGVPESRTAEGIESTTAMTNCLDAAQTFEGVDSLAVVTQRSQAPRFLYCLDKVMRGAEVEIIEAPGEDDPAIYDEERRLLAQSRILYGWARGPRMLRFADRLGTLAGSITGVNPAAKYTEQHSG